MFSQQIINLIENLPKRTEPYILDIVLEGGGFNGSYEIGVLYFIRELERKNYVKINRISGTSIGSVIGTLYLFDKLDSYLELYKEMREHWRENINISLYRTKLISLFSTFPIETFNKIKENKMYITYHNIETNEQIVQSIYSSLDDWREAIYKSSYIPFITNDNGVYETNEQFFIDGGHPYIFHNRENKRNEKILYVSINQPTNLMKILSSKRENNTYGRVLTGILSCYELFLSEKNNSMCSFVNEWGMFDYTGLRIKQLALTILVYLFSLFWSFHTYIYPKIEKYQFYNLCKPVFKNFYKDCILYFCF